MSHTSVSLVHKMTSNNATTACTLRRCAPPIPAHLVRRPHLEQMFDERNWVGSNIIIAGPAGSGKSTIAIQLGLNVADRVQYISARGIPSHVAVADQATFEGNLLAELVNILRWSTPTTPVEEIEQSLLALAEAPLTGTDVLIIDDIDLVSATQIRYLMSASSEQMASLKAPMIIFVTRHLSDELRTWISERGRTRILLPDLLAVTETELEALHTSPPFSSHSMEAIREVWQSTGGWITGMQRLLTPDMSFDEFVLDEIVLAQPRAKQNLIFAIGELPQVSLELVDYLLRCTDTSDEDALAILWQTPLVHGDEPETLHVPDALRSSLARLRRKHGNVANIQAACAHAITWYVRNRMFEEARKLAITMSLGEHYLISIHPVCASYAHQDRWEDILQLTTGIPLHDLVQNGDLAFWTLQALGYMGSWRELDQLQVAVTSNWQQSDQASLRGRSHWLNAWRAWRSLEERSALTMAEEAYVTLPTHAVQERMFAAVTAEVAARHFGDTALINHWSAISNTCRRHLSREPEWWHINCGFHRISHTAISGNLALAYDQASLALDNSDPAYPRITLMFSILMAYIEIELGHFDAAHNTLIHAGNFVDSTLSQSMYDMAMAQYHLTRGEFHRARSLLGMQGQTMHNRADRNDHRLRLLALQEMRVGNYDLAEDILQHWTHCEESWPRYFGEPHHHVIKAMLQVQRGRLEDALATAEDLAIQARDRGHATYVIQALAIQAEAFHRLEFAGELDRVLCQLDELDPKQLYVKSASPFGRNVRLPATLALSRPYARRRQATENLTFREIELLNAADSGLTTRQIAERFSLSQSTVKNHMASVFKKLGVTKRAEALALTQSFRKPAD